MHKNPGRIQSFWRADVAIPEVKCHRGTVTLPLTSIPIDMRCPKPVFVGPEIDVVLWSACWQKDGQAPSLENAPMVTPEALHIRLASWDAKTPVTITTPPDAPTGPTRTGILRNEEGGWAFRYKAMISSFSITVR